MAKWKEIVKDLEVLPVGDGNEERWSPDYAQRIEGARDEFVGMNATALALLYHKVRAETDAKELAAKEARLRMRAMEAQIRDVFAGENVDSVKLSDGTGVRLEYVPYAQVTDQEEMIAWAKKKRLTAPALPWQSLNSTVKDMLLNGQAPPPGVKVWCQIQVKKT